MQSSTGRWVSGNNFFDRRAELKALETLVCDGNHVLLTGQRRMGKTSVAQELGRQLKTRNPEWVFLFVDIEDATCAEDVIAEIAKAAHPVRGILSNLMATMGRWIGDNVDEVSAGDFGVKVRAGLNPGTWRRDGEALLRDCAGYDKPVFLVIDELPVFLNRMLRDDGDIKRVDEFLSWLRKGVQDFQDDDRSSGGGPALVLMVSGSIGLAPLVGRLGISDRINHLHTFRLGPWTRDVSVECFERLADSYDLKIENGVATAVYEKLGIGVPHQVQSFFARLQSFAIMHDRETLRVDDVEEIYRTELLGPSGQNDLAHYETRLKDGLDEESYPVAMEIIAEAAIQDVFTANARRCLERLYASVVHDAPGCVASSLNVLEHDGYLEKVGDSGYCFPSRLLKDWWAARFHGHHVPIASRLSAAGEQEASRG